MPPTLSLVLNTDIVLYLITHPESADSHTMVMGAMVLPEAMENPMFDRLMQINQEGVQDIVAQDLHVDELVQAGAEIENSPRADAYSWQEGAQRQFNVWLGGPLPRRLGSP